jgi:hypothetical protein
LLESFEKRISKFELTLGGDHGKGAFTFLACLIIRFADGSDPKEIELQIGEIGSETDTMEVLQPLVNKLGSLITTTMKPKEGNCRLVVHQVTTNGNLSLHFNDTAAEEGSQVIYQKETNNVDDVRPLVFSFAIRAIWRVFCQRDDLSGE